MNPVFATNIFNKYPLIPLTSRRIQQIVSGTGEADRLMQSLVTGIKEVAFSVSSIADESANQSSSLEEVVKSVGDIDRMTLDNSGLVDRTAHRAKRLTQRSEELIESVSHLRLMEGTADEAMEMAIKAFSHVKQFGLEKAVSDFHDHSGGFIDRNLYVFIFDREGVYRVLGSSPSLVGTNVKDGQGVNGQQIFEDAWNRANTGESGWIDYEFTDPATGQIRLKSSFIIPLEDDLLLGCGAYRGSAIATNVEA